MLIDLPVRPTCSLACYCVSTPLSSQHKTQHLLGIISSILVLYSQSPYGPASGAPDSYGLGRGAAGPCCATSAGWARAELHWLYWTGRSNVGCSEWLYGTGRSNVGFSESLARCIFFPEQNHFLAKWGFFFAKWGLFFAKWGLFFAKWGLFFATSLHVHIYILPAKLMVFPMRSWSLASCDDGD